MASGQVCPVLVRCALLLLLPVALACHAEEPPRNMAFATAAAERFTGALERQRLAFLTPDKLDAMQQDLHDLASQYAPAEMAPEMQSAILAGIDRYIIRFFRNREESIPNHSEQVYMHFADYYLTFKWLFWRALTRTPATPEEEVRLAQQRRWMRDLVVNTPVRTDANLSDAEADKKARGQALAALEAEWSDPLSLLYDAMSNDELTIFTERMTESADGGLASAMFSLSMNALLARIHRFQHLPRPEMTFMGPNPFSEVSEDWGGDGLLMFTSNAYFRGQMVTLTGSERAAGILCASEPPSQLDPYTAPVVSVADVLQWTEKEGKGVLAFNAQPARLFPVRGAKIALLAEMAGLTQEIDWFRIDRIPDADLRAFVRAHACPEVPLDRLLPVNDARTRRVFLVMETREERLIILELQRRSVNHLELLARIRPPKSLTGTPWNDFRVLPLPGMSTGGIPSRVTVDELLRRLDRKDARVPALRAAASLVADLPEDQRSLFHPCITSAIGLIKMTDLPQEEKAGAMQLLIRIGKSAVAPLEEAQRALGAARNREIDDTLALLQRIEQME